MTDKATTAAIAELFRQHDTAIRALIRRYARCREDAEDMYQDLYLSLVRRPPPHQTHILAYLNKVIQHRATDVARHVISEYGSFSKYGARWKDRTHEKESEYILITIEETHKVVNIILASLPAHLARAILDRYLYDKPIRETAQGLGVNERTVSHYCCTGLRRIRQLAAEGKVLLEAWQQHQRPPAPEIPERATAGELRVCQTGSTPSFHPMPRTD